MSSGISQYLGQSASGQAVGSEPVKPGPGRAVRLDIEGMRALAVGSVVAFHAGVGLFAGGFVGVDVFFVLSGFLITSLLVREVTRTGRVSLGAFWARRIRRLLPASLVVLAFSAVVTYLYLPITQRKDFGGDIVSSALYVVNWRLADRSVDYMAEDVGSSPVQHYWSLAVEEQFYILWPVLVLIVAVVAARRWRLGLFLVLGLASAASFAWSVHQSVESPETAFFVSTTRVWELGAGALLALAIGQVARVPALLRALAGWVGLAAILFAVFSFDGSTTWPGAPTLLPVLGTCLVIASGVVETRGGPGRLLSVRPAVWIGGLSYSIYLWHWPILVAAEASHPGLELRWKLLLMIGALVPAWLCHQFIENPVRFGKTWKRNRPAWGLGVVLTAMGVAMGLVLNATVGLGSVVELASKSESPGAVAISDPANSGVVWSEIKAVDRMRPLPQDAAADRLASREGGSWCEVSAGTSEPKLCTYGDKTAQTTVMIVGDSKMAQWQAALDALGKREHWRIVAMTKNHCPFADVMTVTGEGQVQRDCRDWGRSALGIIKKMKPDAVLTSQRYKTALPSGKTSVDDRTTAAMQSGLESYWSQLVDAKIPLVVLLDNPAPVTAPVYECVAKNLKDLASCSFDRAEGTRQSAAPVQKAAAEQVPGVSVVDMSPDICPDGAKCAAVIGNVVVYRQGTHLTASYVETLTAKLGKRLAKAIDGHQDSAG